MKAYRFDRIFNPRSRRALIFATSPWVFRAQESGRSDSAAVIRGIAARNPDALELSLSQTEAFHSVSPTPKPALILRADIASRGGGRPFCRMIHNIVEQAVRTDAAAILAQWIDSAESPALVRQCRENIVRLKPSCERFSIPLIIESAPEHARCALDIGAEAVKISGLTSAGQLRDLVSIRGKTPIFAVWSASLDVSPETMFELGAQAVVVPVLDDIDTPNASTL